jgi:peroxiredoxin
VALAGVAGAVAARGPGAALGAVDPVAAVAAVAVALLVLESVVLVALLRRHGQVLAQIDELRDTTTREEAGLAIGTPAPSFALESATGELVSLDDLLGHELPVVLTFVDRGCGPCAALLPELAGWQDEHADRLTVAIVARGDGEANRATAEEHGIALLLVDSDDVADAYGSKGTPSAVIVDPDGRVATRLSYGADRIRALVADQLELAPEAVLTGV